MTDTIVEEVREIRAALAERFGDDRRAFLAWAREQSRQTGGESAGEPSRKKLSANNLHAVEESAKGGD